MEQITMEDDMDELTQRIEAAKKELFDAHTALFSVIDDAEKGLVRIEVDEGGPGSIRTYGGDTTVTQEIVAIVDIDSDAESVYARRHSLLVKPQFVPEIREYGGRHYVVFRRKGGAND